MFENLDDEIKRDDAATTTAQNRWLRYATVAITALVLFGALFAAVQFLE